MDRGSENVHAQRAAAASGEHGFVPPPDPEVFRRLIEESHDLVVLLGLDGRFRYINSAAERWFDLPVSECVGRAFADFVHPDDRPASIDSFEGWTRGRLGAGTTFENRIVGASGRVRHALWIASPHRDERGQLLWISGRAHDVTQQKRFERGLVESEARNRAILSSSLDPLITIDAFGVVHSVSDSVRETFGYRPEELVGRNISVLMPEPHRSRHDDYLEKYDRTSETWILNTTREFEVVHKDGRSIACELSVARVDVPGEPRPYFLGSFRDISERRRARKALQESEARFRAIFDQEFQFVGLLDPRGTLLEINRAALALIGQPRAAVLGQPFWETPWWSSSPKQAERLRVALERAVEDRRLVRYEANFRDRSGDLRTIDFSLKPILDERGEVGFVIPEGRDVTELKRAQHSEHQTLKALAQVGESAAVLAHEIKNPITAVNVALRVVADQLGEDSKAVLEDLSGRMQRLERMLRETLAFAKNHVIDLQPCEARALLEQSLGHSRVDLVRAGVTIEMEVSEPEIRFLGDASRLDEVLTNLLQNAAQAAGKGGRLRLRAERSGDEVALVVEDDGPGVDESVRDDLFKPFVTTREGGTGLGLSICRRIVEEHGGRIEAGSSEELGGARFSVLLPARAEEGEA